MNVLVTVNSNYIRPLKIMLTSFFEFNKGRHSIFFLYNNVTSGEIEEIRRLVEGAGSILCPVRMTEECAGLPVFQYFSVEMYYRLFAGQMLPPEETRVLYLDPDILIRGSLEELYRTDIGDCVLAGIEDHAVKTLLSDHKKELGFQEQDVYINSGVLLINLTKLRKVFRAGAVVSLVDEAGEKFCYPDQDLINLLFRGKILPLERKYNYNTGYGSVKEALKYCLGGCKKEKKYPVIVHYMGKTKPWHLDYYGKFGKEYRRYLRPFLTAKERRIWRKRGLAVLKHMGGLARRKTTGEKG